MLAEKMKCPACSLDMVESKGVYICMAWDGVQPQEVQYDANGDSPLPRNASPWDKLHIEYDNKRMKEWYPEQKS